MLKRRRRIQKYISALKSKKESLSKHSILQNSITSQQSKVVNAHKSTPLQKQIPSFTPSSQIEQQQLWHDSDQDNTCLALNPNQNVYKKLQLSEQTTPKQYQGKLKQFYQKKYKMKNWARQGDGQEELGMDDYLDMEENYQSKDQMKENRVRHFARTTEKHMSVVTGIDWYGDLLFTAGYDQKLKIFKINTNEENPDLKVKLERDIFIEKLPITACYYNRGSVYCGTLRKNLAVVDPIKEKITFVTSSFLSDHKKYQNLRICKQTNQKLIFSANKISILDYKNSYTGSLLSSEQLKDVRFGMTPHTLYGVSNDSIYEWDLRMYKPTKIDKTYLGYTSLQVTKDYICSGSKLGMIYINENIKTQGPYPLHHQNENLTTTISGLCLNKDQSMVLALSKWKQNAGRIVDLNKGKCMGSWPSNKTKIQFGNVGAFSRQSDMFAVGSSNGFINIFDFQTEN